MPFDVLLSRDGKITAQQFHFMIINCIIFLEFLRVVDIHWFLKKINWLWETPTNLCKEATTMLTMSDAFI